MVALCLGGLLYYAKSHQHPPTQTLSELGLTCENKPDLCRAEVGSPPLARAPNGMRKSGRWNQAALLPNVGDETALRFKRWIYLSAVSDRYFVATALVKFSYISDVFLYVVDRETREQFEYKGRLPFGVGLSQYMYSSVANCTKWGVPKPQFGGRVGDKPWIELCSKPGGGYTFRASVWVVDAQQQEHWLEVGLTAHSGVDLILAYPLAGDETRLAYVHKVAGMTIPAATSHLRLGEREPAKLDNAAAALDWTKGKMLYRTAWRWVSFNDPKARTQDGKAVGFGINLSTGVYDVEHENGDAVSCENAVWVNGKLIALTGRVEITPGALAWRIHSTRPTAEENIDLVFTPWGLRQDHADFGLVVSDFVQPFGEFTGRVVVRGAEILLSPKVFGVVEDHLAYW